jgi:hypothetical protein
MFDSGDPGRVFPQLARPVVDCKHDRGRPVGDWRDVVAPQRISEERPIAGSTESTRLACAKESRATRAMCSKFHLPESSPRRACSPAIDTESGHSGATV